VLEEYYLSHIEQILVANAIGNFEQAFRLVLAHLMD
jgi:hypothetical protein